MGEPALDRLHDGITAADDLLYKALRLREVTRIARLESRLRRYLLAKWEEHARAAKSRAGKMAEQLKSVSEISRAVKKEMEKWAKEVLPRHKETVERIYRLARQAGWKKANKRTTASLSYSTPNLQEIVAKKEPLFSEVVPAFDLVDEEVIEALQEHQTFWLGDHYDENVGKTIADTSRETMIEAGKDRRAAGRLMRERIESSLQSFAVPGAFRGSAAKYMEGLAANAATVARSFGQMKSFRDAGVIKYEWNAVNDRRTCLNCSHMDGKIFTVDQGTSVMDAELRAKTPTGVKRAHPFIGESAAGIARLRSLSPTKGRGPAKESAKLAGAGIAMPPIHFR